MSAIINGDSPSVTFSDGTTQSTALTTGAVTKAMVNTSTANGFGLCRAWVNFSGTTINASYNVTSVTNIATGVYQITFTTAFANTNYCPLISSAFASGTTENVVGTVYNDSPYAPTTTVLTVAFHNGATAARVNPTIAYVAVLSS